MNAGVGSGRRSGLKYEVKSSVSWSSMWSLGLNWSSMAKAKASTLSLYLRTMKGLEGWLGRFSRSLRQLLKVGKESLSSKCFQVASLWLVICLFVSPQSVCLVGEKSAGALR